MARFASPLLWLAGLLVLVMLAGLALVSSDALKLSIDELERRYITPDSKFVDIDGVRTHYMDQGTGPVVVLLHATLMNLQTLDALAAALVAADYRVIRMDRLLSGLTGADPSNQYSVERETELLEGLLDKLKVDQFALFGTSSAGTLAFRYAAQNPQRVTQLLLVNSAGMPRTSITNPNRQRGSAFGRWIRKYYRSKAFWKEELAKNFVLPGVPPEWLVQMVYDHSRRQGLGEQVAIYMKNYRTGDPEKVLAEISAPTLVLWGMKNATVNHLEAEVFEHWLKNALVTKKKYPDTGHYLYLEKPELVAEDVLDFLARSAPATP